MEREVCYLVILHTFHIVLCYTFFFFFHSVLFSLDMLCALLVMTIVHIITLFAFRVVLIELPFFVLCLFIFFFTLPCLFVAIAFFFSPQCLRNHDGNGFCCLFSFYFFFYYCPSRCAQQKVWTRHTSLLRLHGFGCWSWVMFQVTLPNPLFSSCRVHVPGRD